MGYEQPGRSLSSVDNGLKPTGTKLRALSAFATWTFLDYQVQQVGIHLAPNFGSCGPPSQNNKTVRVRREAGDEVEPVVLASPALVRSGRREQRLLAVLREQRSLEGRREVFLPLRAAPMLVWNSRYRISALSRILLLSGPIQLIRLFSCDVNNSWKRVIQGKLSSSSSNTFNKHTVFHQSRCSLMLSPKPAGLCTTKKRCLVGECFTTLTSRLERWEAIAPLKAQFTFEGLGTSWGHATMETPGHQMSCLF